MGHLTEVAEVGEEEEGWDLSRPENGWKDRRGVVGRPQAALPLPASLPKSPPPPPPPALRSPGEEEGASE